MKIIFLDLDGVVNYTKWYISEEYQGLTSDQELDIDPSVIIRLNQLCDECNANIVISSSWKINPYYKDRLERAGLKNIIDKTPDLIWLKPGNYSRGEEIDFWLNNHDNIENYIIIDDVDAFTEKQQEHFLKINPMYGFTDEDFSVAKNMLSRCVNG